MKQGNMALYVAVHVRVEGWQFRPQDPGKYVVKMARSVYPKKHNFLHNWRFPFLPSVSGNTVEGAEATAICNGEDAWWDCNGAAGAELYYGSQFIARANGCGTCNWWR